MPDDRPRWRGATGFRTSIGMLLLDRRRCFQDRPKSNAPQLAPIAIFGASEYPHSKPFYGGDQTSLRRPII